MDAMSLERTAFVAFASKFNKGVETVYKNKFPPIVGYVCERVTLPGMTLEEMRNYLYILLSRNRYAGGSPLINSRLVDKRGQPIYLLDVGDPHYPPTLSGARVVYTLMQAKQICPGLQDTQLPEPLQWSDDPADLIWNPRLEVLPISAPAAEHILSSRAARLPAAIQSCPGEVQLRFLREALSEGTTRARRDCAFALPMYSRQEDTVNMLLPLYIFASHAELPEAVLLIRKTAHGYKLATIITPQQAYRSVRAFRDPENTWLRGALQNE